MLKDDVFIPLLQEKNVFFKTISASKGLTANAIKETEDPAEVKVYKIEKDSTFSQMFNKPNAEIKKLYFTWSQAKDFVEKNFNWLRWDKHLTLLLIEHEGHFIVICIYSYSGGSKLDAIFHKLESDHVCSAGNHRFVIPL